MTNHLTIQLFGRFHLTHSTAAVDLAQRPRLQTLLAYLILHRFAVPRRQISAALWPDVNEATGRNRLRNLLHQLRQQLPNTDDFVHADSTTLSWHSDAACDIDVVHFLDGWEAARVETDRWQQERMLAQTVLLYQGVLFPDCYDEWIEPLRAQFHNHVVDAYDQLITLAADRRGWNAAQSYAERLRYHEPLREQTYCRLMTIYAEQGDRAAVMETYRQCRALLERELNMAPSKETQALYSRLTLSVNSSADVETAPISPSAIVEAAATTLIGRSVELATLHHHWQHVQSGLSRLILIQGDAGVGKSKLAAEYMRQAREQGIATAVATCYATASTTAYTPVAEWLRADVIWQTLDGLEDIWLTEIARLVPEIQSRYPTLPAPTPLQESWQQQHFLAALTITMLEHGQPLILLLEDLQWADDESCLWLHHLLYYQSSTPLLVIATLRIENAYDRQRIQRLFQPLTRPNLLQTIELSPLSIVDTATLGQQLLGRELYPPQAAQLFHETEGNPLFIVETIRAIVEGNRDAGAKPAAYSAETFVVHHLPPKVRTLMESRLANLSTTAMAIVQFAAIIGRRFAYSLLVTSSGESEESVLTALDELWRDQIIREVNPNQLGGRQEYDFTHDKLREVVYAMMSPIRRRHLHGKVGEALALARQAGDDTLYGQSAFHFEVSGHYGKAVEHYHKAGHYSVRLFAFQQAAGAYANAIRLARQIDLPIATLEMLYSERGRLLELSGDYTGAIATYRELEALAKLHNSDSLALLALERLATCYIEPSTVHDRAAAMLLLDRGITLARTLADPHAEARLLRTRMVDLSHYGTFEEARQIGEQALQVAHEHGLRAELASILNDLAVPLRLSGQQEVAQQYADRARTLFQEAGDLPLFADNLAQQAWHHLHQLALTAADQAADECIALCEQINNGWNLCLAWQTKGQVASLRGRWGMALNYFETALDYGKQAGFVVGEVVTPLLLGELLRTLGDGTQAIRLHQSAYFAATQKAPFFVHAARAHMAIDDYYRGHIESGNQWLAAALESQPQGAIGRAWSVLAAIPQAAVMRAVTTGARQEELAIVDNALVEAQMRRLPLYQPPLLIAKARLFLALEDFDAAEALLYETITAAKTATLTPLLWQSYRSLADLYKAQKRQEAHVQVVQLAVQERNVLAASLSTTEQRERFLAANDI